MTGTKKSGRESDPKNKEIKTVTLQINNDTWEKLTEAMKQNGTTKKFLINRALEAYFK